MSTNFGVTEALIKLPIYLVSAKRVELLFLASETSVLPLDEAELNWSAG